MGCEILNFAALPLLRQNENVIENVCVNNYPATGFFTNNNYVDLFYDLI